MSYAAKFEHAPRDYGSLERNYFVMHGEPMPMALANEIVRLMWASRSGVPA